MDIGQLFSSLNLIAIIALVITVLVLLFELRHLVFHKRVAKNPVIPDFDGNIHTVSDHATHINVDLLEHKDGINIVLVIILLGIITILVIIVLGGFLLTQHPISPAERDPALQDKRQQPTEIIEIGNVTPTSPFEESQEVPFGLSGTPMISSVTTTTIPVSGSGGSALTSSVTVAVQTSATTTTSPTLPVSGNYRIFMVLTLIPIVLLALAVVF